jgi:hypothetical protein
VGLRTVSVSVRENVGTLDRDGLERRLLAEPGIAEIFFRGGEPHRLFVAYDPAVLNDSLLLTRLYQHGMHPEPVAPKAPGRALPTSVPQPAPASPVLWMPP